MRCGKSAGWFAVQLGSSDENKERTSLSLLWVLPKVWSSEPQPVLRATKADLDGMALSPATVLPNWGGRNWDWNHNRSAANSDVIRSSIRASTELGSKEGI